MYIRVIHESHKKVQFHPKGKGIESDRYYITRFLLFMLVKLGRTTKRGGFSRTLVVRPLRKALFYVCLPLELNIKNKRQNR